MSSPESGRDLSALAVGQTVCRRYLLKRILGEGGMGVVWLAHDTRLREPVALKFLPSEISGDQAALETLRRETLRSRKLSHPNIIRIHDLYGEDGEPPFICMEFVDGPNLHYLRAQRPSLVLGWKFLAPLVAQLCEALDYAHNNGVLHRDLKPANLMLDSNGRLKLADFGLARVIHDSSQKANRAGEVSGTLQYMSPQQAAGDPPAVGDDIYSLGATLYELLTGTPPFHVGDIGYQIKNTRPQPLGERLLEFGLSNDDLPSDVAALVMSCLAKEPAQRPQSALEILRWIGGRKTAPSTGGSTSTDPHQAGLSISHHTIADDEETSISSYEASDQRARFGMLLLFAVATIAAIWFWVSRNRSSSSSIDKQTLPTPAIAQTQNLLVNGSFEMVDASAPPFMITSPDSTPGWKQILDGVDLVHNKFTQVPPVLLEASDGVQFLDMNQKGLLGGIEQVVNAVTGVTYRLELETAAWAQNAIGGKIEYELYDPATGNSLAKDSFSDSVGGTWTTRQLEATAISSSIGVRIQGLVATQAGMGLDNVRLTAVRKP